MIIEQLVGKTFTNVFSRGDELIFEGPEGRGVFFHSQDCCESVYIDEIVGDLHDLEYTPILTAEERTGDTPPGVAEPGESYTSITALITLYKGSRVLLDTTTSIRSYAEARIIAQRLALRFRATHTTLEIFDDERAR